MNLSSFSSGAVRSMEGEAGGTSREMRPVREWGLDPMCFVHVRLLAFDLLSLRQLPYSAGSFARNCRPVRKVEMVGVVVSVDQKERYLRFACMYVPFAQFFLDKHAKLKRLSNILIFPKVDDGTGCVPCVLWMNHSTFPITSPIKGLELELQKEMTAALAMQVKLGHVLRVHGRLTTFNNQIQITVSSIQMEQDPNAEVLHWMECLCLSQSCYDLDPPSPQSKT